MHLIDVSDSHYVRHTKRKEKERSLGRKTVLERNVEMDRDLDSSRTS